MDLRMRNQSVLVTGASRGIGFAAARAFAAQGCALRLVARDPDDGVRAVGVHPGLVATDRQITRWRQRAADAWGDAERWRELTGHLPFGRMAEPAQVANVIVFLASSAAAYISGTCVAVDGGFSQRRSAR
jgi:3-oxoacyl-[acyl-carrier protein] reductase